MKLPIGTAIFTRDTGEQFNVIRSTDTYVEYSNGTIRSIISVAELFNEFTLTPTLPSDLASSLDTQVGGDHYKKLGDYQPWLVLRACMTAEELRGYMKGTAIAYLMRERDKGGTVDIKKAAHTLAGYLDLVAK
jgi:hypothetical protein